MTIIAGFNCMDGIVICADTEELVADRISRSNTDKLKTVQLNDDDGWMVFGGAGESGLIEYTVTKLARQLWGVSDWIKLEDELNRHAREIFRMHIRVYAGMPAEMVPDLAFMIAAKVGNETRLFKWERNYVVQVHPYGHDSVGVGNYQATPLLRELALSCLCEQMIFFAARLMKKVKSVVPGCGGDTDVMTLKRDGALELYNRAYVQKLERFSLELDRFCVINPMLHITAPKQSTKDAVSEALDKSIQIMKKFRKRYADIEPASMVIARPKSQRRAASEADLSRLGIARQPDSRKT